LLGDALFERRRGYLRVFNETLQRERNDGEITLTRLEVDLWLHVLNDMRLMVATEMDICENGWFEDEALRGDRRMYGLAVLSALQEDLLRGVMSGE
jgi:hypothetical protein